MSFIRNCIKILNTFSSFAREALWNFIHPILFFPVRILIIHCQGLWWKLIFSRIRYIFKKIILIFLINFAESWLKPQRQERVFKKCKSHLPIVIAAIWKITTKHFGLDLEKYSSAVEPRLLEEIPAPSSDQRSSLSLL